MDSLNLSETQNNSLNFKNTGSNTSPIVCSCCCSKYYMQCLPQPCCFRIHPPEMNNCKNPQELFEESIKNSPSGFIPFPLFHPIFHNSILPVNSCHAHNQSNDAVKSEEKKECGNVDESDPNLSNQEKNEMRGNNAKMQKEQKFASRPVSPTLGHPFNLRDPHLNSFFQPNGWGDFMPWTCNSFFAPMMSYCLFWNSHKLAANNYCSNSAETEGTSNKSTNRTPSSDETETTDIRSCSVKVEQDENNDESGESLEREEETIGCSNTNSDSVCEGEVSGGDPEIEELENVEKEEEVAECSKISFDSACGEEEEMETERFDSAVQLGSNEYFKMEENDFLNYKTYSCSSNEPKENISDRSLPLVESEISDLTVRQISAVDTSASETQVNLSDSWPVDDNVFLSYPDNESGKSNLATEKDNNQDNQERMSCKKTFKNFTIADQTNDVFLNEAQISVAAAGDLGGDNCVGYKVTIVPFEKDAEQVSPETKPLEHQQKNFELKAPKNLQKNKLSESVKNSKETPKSLQTSKSKIAKLLNNSKPKESKTEALKNPKQIAQPNKKETNTVRNKHNCLINYNTSNNNVVNVKENTTKIQKTRNCTVVEKQIQGPKKTIKETNLKNQSNKNEKKFQRLKL